MGIYWASVQKELRLLGRNVHALGVLFVMPLAFVLIMSLALQDQIDGRASVLLKGSIDVEQRSALSDQFRSQLEQNDFIDLNVGDGESELFKVLVKQNFDEVVEAEYEGESAVVLSFSPLLGLREQYLILSAVKESFAIINAQVMADGLGFDAQYVDSAMLKPGAVTANVEAGPVPINATQQNVPAWLVFAMFFISLPIATVVLYEQQQRTLLRLRCLGLSSHQWLLAKLLPYFIINLVQFGFLLLVGVYILPLLGGSALSLSVSWAALLVMAVSVSVAALGFAALVACFSRSIEQATIIAGTSNILFGAVGGIMVPKFVMPSFMQGMIYFSPMGWGLEGFIGVLAFGDGLEKIWLEVVVLISLGLFGLGVANAILKRRV